MMIKKAELFWPQEILRYNFIPIVKQCQFWTKQKKTVRIVNWNENNVSYAHTIILS